jgi:molybdopterin-binding protein
VLLIVVAGIPEITPKLEIVIELFEGTEAYAVIKSNDIVIAKD